MAVIEEFADRGRRIGGRPGRSGVAARAAGPGVRPGAAGRRGGHQPVLRRGPAAPAGASDPATATAERLRFTVGAGPCLTAHAEGRPQVADEATIRSRWPAFHDELVARTPIRGAISLPLEDRLRGVGALDLYTVPPNDVTSLRLADALEISAELSAVFAATSRAARQRRDGPVWLEAPAAERRSVVWQAMGLLNSGPGVSSTAALALLRALAYAHGEDLDELCRRVVEREIPLDGLAS